MKHFEIIHISNFIPVICWNWMQRLTDTKKVSWLIKT